MKRRRRFGLPQGYGRDPFRVTLKSTAKRSEDMRQLAMDLWVKPAPAATPWPTVQIDLEDYLASLPEKPKP